jgi:hypothetical protein
MEAVQAQEQATNQVEASTLRETLKGLTQFLRENQPSTAATIASKRGDPVEDTPSEYYEVRELNIQSDLSQKLLAIADNAAQKAQDRRLIPHEIGHSPSKDELAYLNLANHPDIETAINFLVQVDAAKTFEEDSDFAETVDFYALVPSYKDQVAAFLRKPSTRRDLAVDSTRREGLRACLGESNRYQEFDQKVFRFDGRIDLIAWNGWLFINSNHKLRQILGKFQAVLKEVEKHSQNLTQKLPSDVEIANPDDLEEACKADGRLASKLAQVVQRDYWDRVTGEDIERVIKNYGLDESGKIDYEDGSITYSPSPQQRWTLLKLLDDDYLGSEMTDEKYEADNKRALQ